MSTVDILIPFYNAEATLARALSSVEAQTFHDWNVILIDDGSDDSSKKIAQAFAEKNSGKCALINSVKPQSGAASSRNEGLKHAKGLYVMCLDSDDLLLPFCLVQRVAVMVGNIALDWAIFNQYQVAPGATEPLPVFNQPVETREDAIAVFLQMLPAWQTMAPLWKREILQGLGGFDASLYPMEDLDLHLRALLENDLKFEIKSNLAPDCYYHVANKSDDKMVSFYAKDIEAKFLYARKIVAYLPGKISSKRLKIYKAFIRKGFFIFLSTVLLARLKGYIKEVKEITLLLQKERIISAIDVLAIKAIIMLFTSSSLGIKKLKIRGLVQKLFLNYARNYKFSFSIMSLL